MIKGNVIFEYFVERGAKRSQEEIAKKMLSNNYDVLDIIIYTDIDAERLRKIRDDMRSESVSG